MVGNHLNHRRRSRIDFHMITNPRNQRCVFEFKRKSSFSLFRYRVSKFSIMEKIYTGTKNVSRWKRRFVRETTKYKEVISKLCIQGGYECFKVRHMAMKSLPLQSPNALILSCILCLGCFQLVSSPGTPLEVKFQLFWQIFHLIAVC